jgi:ABC-type protease/lipase transport system fused ATPase/permease subunit
MGTFLTVILVIFAILGVIALFSMIFFFSLAMAIQREPEKFEKEINDMYEKQYVKQYGRKPDEPLVSLKRMKK